MPLYNVQKWTKACQWHTCLNCTVEGKALASAILVLKQETAPEIPYRIIKKGKE